MGEEQYIEIGHGQEPISVEEYHKLMKKYFPNGTSGELTSFTMQLKHKLLVLNEIIPFFEKGREYKEIEVNRILKGIYPKDHVVIRRYLVSYHYLNRTTDGSVYWVGEEQF